jgi:membrane dipeptidase
LNLLKIFYQLGLRICGLAYTRRNAFADGCGEKTDCGLSRIGELAVEEMNKLGVLIDLSHCGYTASMQAIDLSKDPVSFTHSCARGVYDHIRNLTDEQIKACAEKGGVIGVNAFSNYLHPKGLAEGATVAHSLNHIDYIVNLVGVDHVGIGTDTTESRTVDEALELARAYPELGEPPKSVTLESIRKRYALKSIMEIRNYTRGLVARGYSDQEILKILGGNFLRLFKKVWKK